MAAASYYQRVDTHPAAALIRRLNEARIACGAVTAETGSLLADDECVLELKKAHAALNEYDRRRGYSRTQSTGHVDLFTDILNGAEIS